MESIQREILSVLLERVFASGLISKNTYMKAEDLVHSVIDIPEFVQYTVSTETGEIKYECT